MKGISHTETWKREMSKRNSGENNPNYGNRLSLKTEKLLSRLKKGKKHSIETRLKMSGKTPWNKGNTGIYSKETISKISKAMSNRVTSLETKEKQRKASTGRKLSQEAKISIGNKIRAAARIKRLKLIA